VRQPRRCCKSAAVDGLSDRTKASVGADALAAPAPSLPARLPANLLDRVLEAASPSARSRAASRPGSCFGHVDSGRSRAPERGRGLLPGRRDTRRRGRDGRRATSDLVRFRDLGGRRRGLAPGSRDCSRRSLYGNLGGVAGGRVRRVRVPVTRAGRRRPGRRPTDDRRADERSVSGVSGNRPAAGAGFRATGRPPGARGERRGAGATVPAVVRRVSDPWIGAAGATPGAWARPTHRLGGGDDE
jgi:hypothetical protein